MVNLDATWSCRLKKEQGTKVCGQKYKNDSKWILERGWSNHEPEYHIPPAERLQMLMTHCKIPQPELNLQPYSPEDKRKGEVIRKRGKN